MKSYIEIEGGKKLSGEVRIGGAKNSILALMAGSILSDKEVVTIDDAPNIADVYIVCDILKKLGNNVIVSNTGVTKQIIIDTENCVETDLTFEEISKLRASYYFMGSMLAKYKKLKISLPGGCFLGPRPIDLHLKGFEAMGAKIDQKITPDGEIISIDATKGLQGANIFLDVSSVGATINLILAATQASGETVIENAAKEPEVIDLATMLNNMGAKIKGAGTDIIKIKGVKKMHGCYHQVIPDRIEAGTYILFAVATNSEIKIKNIIPEHIESLISKLKEMGAKFKVGEDFLEVKKHKKLLSKNIKTGTYPSFATDLQQVFATMLTQSEGTGKIEETIYEERFKNCEEVERMGAKVIFGKSEVAITGITKLKGTDVYASDLRAGAALILAGLLAEGKTRIYNIHHIHRGYEMIEEKIINLGGDIKIVEEN